MIIRTDKRQTRYSVVDNTGFEDSRLSLKAKGLLGYFLTKPDHWEVRIEDLVKRSPDGRDSIQGGLRELAKFGYAELKVVRGSGGRIGGKQWVIHEAPVESVVSPTDGKPASRSNELEFNDLGFSSPSPTNGFSVGRQNRRTVKPSDGKPAHIVSTEVITNTEVLGNTECEQKRAHAEPKPAASMKKPVGQKTPPISAAPPSLFFSESSWALASSEEWSESFRAAVDGIPADPAWYLNRVRDWSAEKGGTSKDWVATAARFAKDDLVKNKLVTIQQIHNVISNRTQDNPTIGPSGSRAANRSPIVDPDEVLARTARIIARRNGQRV